MWLQTSKKKVNPAFQIFRLNLKCILAWVYTFLASTPSSPPSCEASWSENTHCLTSSFEGHRWSRGRCNQPTKKAVPSLQEGWLGLWSSALGCRWGLLLNLILHFCLIIRSLFVLASILQTAIIIFFLPPPPPRKTLQTVGVVWVLPFWCICFVFLSGFFFVCLFDCFDSFLKRLKEVRM